MAREAQNPIEAASPNEDKSPQVKMEHQKAFRVWAVSTLRPVRWLEFYLSCTGLKRSPRPAHIVGTAHDGGTLSPLHMEAREQIKR